MAVKKNTKDVIATNTTKAMEERMIKEALAIDPLMAEKIAKSEKAMKDANAWAKTESCPEIIKEFILGGQEIIDRTINRIKELYGIDATNMKISDAVNAFNMTQAQLEAEANTAAHEREASIEELTNQYKEAEEYYKKKTEKDHKQVEEEWEEQLKKKEKEWDEREAEISAKEDEMTELQDRILELETIIAGHADEVATAVKTAEGKAKAMAEAKATTDAKLVETTNKAEVGKLEYKISILECQITDLISQRDKALEQAESAGKRLEDVTKAFAASQNATVNVTTTGK